MKTKLTSILFSAAVLALAAGRTHADTVVLDDYSTDDSQNYSNVTYYDSATYPSVPANNTYSLTTSGGVGVVSPGNQDSTEAFFYTPGGTDSTSLGIGDTVTLDVTDNTYTTNLVGLAFQTNTTNAPGAEGFQIYLGAENGDGYGNGGGVAAFQPNGTDLLGTPTSSTGFSTISVTRLASDPTGESFSFDISGNGLTDSGTFTEATLGADATLYFGPSYYNHTFATQNDVQFDNLKLTTPSVPEPSAMALFACGLGVLVLVVVQRVRKSNS